MDVKKTSTLADLLRAATLALATLGAAGLLVTASACENEGPAESAGETVDEAVEDTGRAVDDALD